MDLALRERQIVEKRRALVTDAADVCGSCGSDMVTSKILVDHGMSYRRRYCPLCTVGENSVELINIVPYERD